MRLIYVANVRIPSERAHGIQIMNTCSGLVSTGVEVELWIPENKGNNKEDPFEFYGLPKNFSILYLSGYSFFNAKFFGKVLFLIRSLLFSASIVQRMFSRADYKNAIFYGREDIMLYILSFFTKNIFWESHMGGRGFFAKELMKKSRGIVCISMGILSFYKNMGIDERKLLLSPDAVNMSIFSEAKTMMKDHGNIKGVPKDAFVVMYSGSIGSYAWKGVDVFLDAIKYLKDDNIRFVVVGGSPKEVSKLKDIYSDERIVFIGQVRPHLVSSFLISADVLVVPNKAGDVLSEHYTSPMKLFEYMASGRPIIASSLPSIREILSERTAVFFKPNNSRDLAQKIEEILKNPDMYEGLSHSAYEEVRQYTWVKRAQYIKDFIQRRMGI